MVLALEELVVNREVEKDMLTNEYEEKNIHKIQRKHKEGNNSFSLGQKSVKKTSHKRQYMGRVLKRPIKADQFIFLSSLSYCDDLFPAISTAPV